MKSYVVCPDCGTVFGVAERIDDLEVLCYKCKEKLLVNVNEQGWGLRNKADTARNTLLQRCWCVVAAVHTTEERARP